MAVLRIHKKKQNFVILDKTCLNDKSLSWGAKGLHAYLMSLPDDWHVHVFDLKDRAKNGRDAVRGLLSELEQAGYIQKSNVRDNLNGRFGKTEYLVLEIPEPKNLPITPDPENQSSVNLEPKNTASENPSLGLPDSEKATLINNKYNNYLNNQGLNKTAAARINLQAENQPSQPKAAAVLLSPSDREGVHNKTPLHAESVTLLSQQDVLIGSQLTLGQKQRVLTLASSLNVSQKEAVTEEIEFCLLNSKHFTACGKDFSKKLNAIRTVILRGDWQTPAGMMQEVSEAENQSNRAVKQLEEELREAHAEANHFTKLLTTAKEHTQEHFETIINQAQRKIYTIEEQLRRMQCLQKEASC
jgi:hypothetical protein